MTPADTILAAHRTDTIVVVLRAAMWRELGHGVERVWVDPLRASVRLSDETAARVQRVRDERRVVGRKD